jgi:hypothetical protein
MDPFPRWMQAIVVFFVLLIFIGGMTWGLSTTQTGKNAGMALTYIGIGFIFGAIYGAVSYSVWG